jgi:hypothetical protein
MQAEIQLGSLTMCFAYQGMLRRAMGSLRWWLPCILCRWCCYLQGMRKTRAQPMKGCTPVLASTRSCASTCLKQAGSHGERKACAASQHGFLVSKPTDHAPALQLPL